MLESDVYYFVGAWLYWLVLLLDMYANIRSGHDVMAPGHDRMWYGAFIGHMCVLMLSNIYVT